MSTDNFIWTDELVEEYRKFYIENNSVALMLGAVGIIELFKLKIKNGGNVTTEDIISADYKAYEQSEQTAFDSAKKAKEVLFTSNDGKEIFEDTEYYVVSRDFVISRGFPKKYIKYDNIEFRTFSTKEAAEDWILMNKPCLSINDLISAWEGFHKYSPLFFKLEELAKSKISR